MKDSTIKLLFAGVVTIGGLAGVLSVILTGMIMDTPVETVLALAALPAQALIAGLVFFLGFQNGIRKLNGN